MVDAQGHDLDVPGGLHCGVRIALLFCFAAVLPALGAIACWIVIAGIAVWLHRRDPADLKFFANGVWRLRWLLFAIVALHLWQSGGTPIVAQLPGLTDRGAELAARRSGVLIALLGAVVMVTRSTPPAWLAAGLIWCLAPLRRLGVAVDRFGLRVALVFSAVEGSREAAGRIRREHGLEDAAARLLLQAEAGGYAPVVPMSVPSAGRVDRRDGCVLALGLVIVVATHV